MFSHIILYSLSFQTLIPSTTNNFTVNRILPSKDAYLALSGNNGISVLQLPHRCGRNGQYRGGDDEIICK